MRELNGNYLNESTTWLEVNKFKKKSLKLYEESIIFLEINTVIFYLYWLEE